MHNLTDTHCHIQFDDYPFDPAETIAAAKVAGVTRMIAVGCRLHDSEAAINLAAQHDGVWASIGLHPHEGAEYVHKPAALQRFQELATKPKVVAVGETGLDYYYNHSSKDDQEKLLRFQLDLGLRHNLPFIFHVRDAFDDFWTILDDYQGVRGVVHCFSADVATLHQILERDLFVGLNGIMTFSKIAEQLEAARKVTLDKMISETDAPFLTPKPFRGKICEPKHVVNTAEFLADLRGESLEEIAEKTTNNAQSLFDLL